MGGTAVLSTQFNTISTNQVSRNKLFYKFHSKEVILLDMKIILLLVFHIFQTVLCSSIYDFKAVDIHGLEVDFDRFRGKVLLIVNVASECGFTDSHYRELQRIQDVLGFDDHFYVLGFPCNQFGGQEPGDEATIDEFVRTNYEVDFPMFSKVEVQGENIHPLWKHIIDESEIQPKWNFYKYLINHEGKVANVFPSRVSVNDAFDEIIKLVKKSRLASKKKPKTVKKDLKDEL